MQKTALGRLVRKAKNWLAPELGTLARQAADPGRRTLRPSLRAPLAVAGLSAAAYGGAQGLGYLGDQASVIGRARGYRQLMKKYGPELHAIAEQTHVPVPEERMRDVYNALYKMSPDVAKEPTLAAAQMAPLIREAGSPSGTMEGAEGPVPRVMLEGGLEQMAVPSRIQSGMPDSFADRTQPWVRSAVGAFGDYDLNTAAQREMMRAEFQQPDLKAKSDLAADLSSLGRRRMELQALYRQKADALRAGNQTAIQALESRIRQLRTGRPEAASRI